MNRVKKIIIYVLALGLLGFNLTGCTIKLDDEEYGKIQETIKFANIDNNEIKEEVVKEFDKIDINESYTVDNNSVKVTNNKDVSYIGSAYVYSENSSYLNVYGYNSDGEVVWNYKTEPVLDTEDCDSECFNTIDGAVCIIDKGVLKQLDFNTGEILWTINESFKSEKTIEFCGIADTTFIYVLAPYEATLYEYSYNDGSLIKKIDFADEFFYKKHNKHVTEVDLNDEFDLSNEYNNIKNMFNCSKLELLKDFNGGAATIYITNIINEDNDFINIKMNAKSLNDYEIVENIL